MSWEKDIEYALDVMREKRVGDVHKAKKRLSRVIASLAIFREQLDELLDEDDE